MTFTELGLIAIALILGWLGKILLAVRKELNTLRESLVSPESYPPVLNQISGHLYRIAEFIQGARNRESVKRNREERIIRMYASHLQETEGLTEHQASLKAR